MIVTKEWMMDKYQEFNSKYFDNELPYEINFKISTRENQWGFASCRWIYIYSENRVKATNLEITMSNAYDSPEHVKENTLIHEMIHILDYCTNPDYYVYKDNKGWHHRRNYDAHGPLFFQREAKRLTKYGFDVQRYVSKEEESASIMTNTLKNRIDNKKQKGFIIACAFYNPEWAWTSMPKNEAMWFKTTENSLKQIINNILTYKKINGRYPYLSIVAYRTHDPNFEDYGGCRGVIKGWYCSVPEWDNIVNKLTDKELVEHWTFDSINESQAVTKPAMKMLVDGENGIAKLNPDDSVSFRMV